MNIEQSRFPYDATIDAQSVSMDKQRVQHVIQQFKASCESGIFPGGQLVARRFGKMVVNEAFGIARGYRPEERISPISVTSQTLFPVYSIGKAIAATVIAMLEEQGLLNIQQRVAELLPEFQQSDKRDMTIADVLTHRAGIIIPMMSTKTYKAATRDVMLECLIQSKSLYPRGTFAYSPSECGILLCEIVRVLTGKTLASWAFDEISTPLQLTELKFGLSSRMPENIAHSYWQGKDTFMLAGTNFAKDFEDISNDEQVFNTENPAYTLISNAATLAAFFECLVNRGVMPNKKQLLSEEKIGQYTRPQVAGWNKATKSVMAVGLGFQTGMSLFPCAYGYWNTKTCFGHIGSLSSIAFGDHKTGLSVAIVTNGNRGAMDFGSLFIPLSHQLRKACK
jgi:CubicO group peptidase (beta-lactamase class C family)